MTKDKARKRDVRARMAKTGERYAAAQRHVSATRLDTTDLGMSNAAVRKGTGKGWSEWIRILDRWGAREHTHTEIARHLAGDLGVPGWWAQSVTVGYERARGMRDVHQRSDGYCAYASKTVPVDVDELFRAFVDPRARARWLERGTLRVRSSQPGRSARFDLSAGGSRLVASFTAKGGRKSTVHLQHERLEGPAAVKEMQAFWRDRLGRLAESLRR